jgi:hypothetical protein
MKHTPGPWEIIKESEKPWKSDPKEYGYFIAPKHKLPTLAYIVHVYNYPGQMEANAELIAAVPELLEVAEEMLSAVACFGKATITFERWEKVVSKAKGGD